MGMESTSFILKSLHDKLKMYTINYINNLLNLNDAIDC